MADNTITIPALKTTVDISTPSPVRLQETSVPLQKYRGVIAATKDFAGRIFGDFYNSFRLLGYLAQTYYSAGERKLNDKKPELVGDLNNPTKLATDWHRPNRMILNSVETVAYMALAIFASRRDWKKIRNEISDIVMAEKGSAAEIGLKDVRHSTNPIVQSHVGRFKALYTLRLLQPLTFLHSLKLGITSTVIEIIAERAAYFEKNPYEQLLKLSKDIANNQTGSWSRDSIVNKLIDIMQQSRADHKTPPISVQDVQYYYPMLQKVADRMIEKKWGFQEALYVMGQLITQPGQRHDVQNAYNAVLVYGLRDIAERRHTGKSYVPTPAEVAEHENSPLTLSAASVVPSALAANQETKRDMVYRRVEDILNRGPQPLGERGAMQAEASR